MPENAENGIFNVSVVSNKTMTFWAGENSPMMIFTLEVQNNNAL